MTQGQIRSILRSEKFWSYIRENPLDISSKPLIGCIPQELINEVALSHKKKTRLQYNQPRDVEYQPEELIISGAIN